MQKRNIYVPITTGLFIFLALYGVFGFWALDRFFTPDPPGWLILSAVSVFFLGLLLLFICLYRYVRTEELIVRGTFLRLASELGADRDALMPFESPEIGRRRFAGTWAQVEIEHEGHGILLVAKNDPIPTGRSCIPFIAVSLKKECVGSETEQPAPRLTPENHPKFKQLQLELKRTELIDHEGQPAIQMPLKSGISAKHLILAVELLRDSI